MVTTRQLFCSIRKRWVTATPEEMVRQDVLTHLTNDFGCPPHLIAVEHSMARCVRRKSPLRRVDILCYSVDSAECVPFLLIECKAQTPRRQALFQLSGYNFFMKASFQAVAWPGHIMLFSSSDFQIYSPISTMPTYKCLKETL